METPNIKDFDPKIQKQALDWVVRWKSRLMREGKKSEKAQHEHPNL
jgi:hypothetical protein